MDETVIATYDDVKFIQGATKMNQTNWQAYFGTALPNGVYEGLEVSIDSYDRHLSDGKVFANGILAELKTEDGFTDIGRIWGQGFMDRFICLRVWFNEEKAQIVQKAPIAEPPSSSTVDNWNWTLYAEMLKFLEDESYCCERNELYWDIPLFYDCQDSNSYWLCYGRDLRRMINLSGEKTYKHVTAWAPKTILISGNNYYKYSDSQYLYMDDIDIPDGTVYANTSSNASYTVTLRISHFTNWCSQTNNIASGYHSFNFIFSDPTRWTYDSSAGEYTYTIPAHKTAVFRFTMVETIDNSLYPRVLVETFEEPA